MRWIALALVFPITAAASAGEATARTGGKARSAKTGAGAKDKAGKEPVLERVAVVGASLSSGIGCDGDLAAVLEATIKKAHRPVVDDADTMFFMKPASISARQIEKALEAKPTLVVAVDFLFWFGYGMEPMAPIDSEAKRLVFLEEGLKLLDQVKCPLVVGDFPDMSAAAGGILQAGQVPKPETLAALNRRVAEWAKGHPGAILVPLAKHMETIRAGKTVKVGRNEWPASAMMQDDTLYPSTTGLVGVGQMVAEAILRAKLGAVPGDFERDAVVVLKKIEESKKAHDADMDAKAAEAEKARIKAKAKAASPAEKKGAGTR